MTASGSAAEQAMAEIAAARDAMAASYQTILTAAEEALPRQAASPEAERALLSIILACAAEDIAGQRLARALRLLEGVQDDDPLLRGPALAGQGLDQTLADALFAGQDASR